MMEGTPTERLDWIQAVVRQCAPAAIRVAVELQSRYNRQTGDCWPSVARLAQDCQMSERSVQTGIKELEWLGFIVCDRPDQQGRGMATRYLIEWAGGTSKRVKESAPIEPRRVQDSAPKGAENCAERAKKSAPQLREENSVKELTLETRTPDLAATAAPLDLPPRLREAYREIAEAEGGTRAGYDVASRALQAARRIFRLPSEAQLRETYRAAAATGRLDHPPDRWPDFRQQIRRERHAERSGTTATSDPERQAAFAALDAQGTTP
jgi:hypothetical protein